MPKLETQINEIFISPTESKKLSLILFEEKIAPGAHLFLLAELRDIQRKTELNDLGKISEIIIEAFKTNKKLSGEALFETTLADINNSLGDFAHKGRKSWLGKFSALIALQTDKDFYLANTGHTCAWLKRKNELTEIIEPEKTETHPLKTFINFISGKLLDNDYLVLSTSSLFNYISVELFSKILSSNELSESCTKVSEILKSSAKNDEGFAVFMLQMSKRPMPVASITDTESVPYKPANNKPTAAPKSEGTVKSPPRAKSRSMDGMPIYAPLPEDMTAPIVDTLPENKFAILPALPKLPKILFSLKALKFPRFNFNFPKLNFLPNISGPAKFFLVSFILFAVLFAMNIAAYGVRKSQSKHQETFNATAEALVNFMAEAESSLLYKNQSQAMKLMSSAETELHKLQQIDPEKAVPFQAKFEEMNNKINRVTILKNLSSAFEMPYPITFMARAGTGYLVSNDSQNSLGTFSGTEFKNIFMLNSIDGLIRGITHVSGAGNYLVSNNKIYRVNETADEFEQKVYVSNGDLYALKFFDPNRIYTIDKTTNQVLRMTVSVNSVSGPQNVLKGTVNLQEAVDLAVDNDIYVLYPDRLVKFVNGNQSGFQLSPLSEPAQGYEKIRLGNQIYLLEPISKRIMIYSRTGELLNQVKFPDLNEIKDFYVDEGQRELFIVSGNKVYKITF